MSGQGLSAYQRLRQRIVHLLGGRCVDCGFTDLRALQIDHAYSDGALERSDYSGLAYLHHMLRNLGSGRYVIRCANCNFIKRYTHLEDGRRFNLDAVTDLEAFFADEPELDS